MSGDTAVVLFLSVFLIAGVGHTWWWAERESKRLDAEAEAERERMRRRASGRAS